MVQVDLRTEYMEEDENDEQTEKFGNDFHNVAIGPQLQVINLFHILLIWNLFSFPPQINFEINYPFYS